MQALRHCPFRLLSYISGVDKNTGISENSSMEQSSLVPSPFFSFLHYYSIIRIKISVNAERERERERENNSVSIFIGGCISHNEHARCRFIQFIQLQIQFSLT